MTAGGAPECPGCGKRRWPVTHSCTGPRPAASGGATDRDEVARRRRELLGDAIVDDAESPVASAARTAFRLGWDAANEERDDHYDAVPEGYYVVEDPDYGERLVPIPAPVASQADGELRATAEQLWHDLINEDDQGAVDKLIPLLADAAALREALKRLEIRA